MPLHHTPAALFPLTADAEINCPTGDEPLSLYRSNENLNVALEAAEAGGLQVVNIGATDIIQGRPASILGLTWQLIRVHLLAQINLKVTAVSDFCHEPCCNVLTVVQAVFVVTGDFSKPSRDPSMLAYEVCRSVEVNNLPCSCANVRVMPLTAFSLLFSVTGRAVRT